MNPFNIGDMVQLRSGGPAMRVDDIKFGGLHSVSWLDDNGLRQVAEVPLHMLRPAESYSDSARPAAEPDEEPKNYTFNVTVPSNEMRAKLTVTNYLALICFCDLLFRSSLNSLAQQVLGMVIGTLLVWGSEKLWKKYAL